MNSVTVVYYTSNREHEDIESCIQNELRTAAEAADLPIISVSQKPIDLGTNICVGDVGQKAYNGFRQMQIGFEAAKTKFVAVAESDFLYPPEYFRFVPNDETAICVTFPTFILDLRLPRLKFLQKPQGDAGAMVAGRDAFLRRLDVMFADKPMWNGPEFTPHNKVMRKSKINYQVATFSVPNVTIKTERQVHRKHPVIPRSQCMVLPYWGSVADVLKRVGRWQSE